MLMQTEVSLQSYPYVSNGEGNSGVAYYCVLTRVSGMFLTSFLLFSTTAKFQAGADLSQFLLLYNRESRKQINFITLPTF